MAGPPAQGHLCPGASPVSGPLSSRARQVLLHWSTPASPGLMVEGHRPLFPPRHGGGALGALRTDQGPLHVCTASSASRHGAHLDSVASSCSPGEHKQCTPPLLHLQTGERPNSGWGTTQEARAACSELLPCGGTTHAILPPAPTLHFHNTWWAPSWSGACGLQDLLIMSPRSPGGVHRGRKRGLAPMDAQQPEIIPEEEGGERGSTDLSTSTFLCP